MLVLGLILCIVGWLTGISPLVTVGILLVVLAVVFMLLGTAGPIGGRWY